jgi:PAS domain-containing protein
MSDGPSDTLAVMSDGSSDTSQSSRRKPNRINWGAIAKAASRAIGLHEDGFKLPPRLFEQLPFAIYICDRDGLVLRYNHRAAELWGRSPKLGDPNERFCGSYRMYRPDGSPLPPHECPMAEVLRCGISVRQQEVHIERPDGGEAEIVIRWSEADGPPVKAPSSQGFGTRLVGPIVQNGLGGKLRFDWNPDGLACEIVIPLDRGAKTLS